MTTTETASSISKKTLDLLKNFSTINSNILIRPGNKISTISGVKNIMAEAEVDETFDCEFGIWDLSRFLGTISLFDSPEISFNEKYMTISGNNGASVKYFYCEPKLLTTVNKEIKMPEVVVRFSLTEKAFADIQRAASVLQLSDIAVRNNGSEIEMVALNKGDAIEAKTHKTRVATLQKAVAKARAHTAKMDESVALKEKQLMAEQEEAQTIEEARRKALESHRKRSAAMESFHVQQLDALHSQLRGQVPGAVRRFHFRAGCARQPSCFCAADLLFQRRGLP